MSFALNDGREMPAVGLGTYRLKDKGAVLMAIEAGYRHIDTASRYKNEEIIGQAIKEALERSHGAIKREDLFISTKLWYEEYADIEGAVRGSITRLGLEYLDLYLVHWPAGFFASPKKPMHQVWAELEALVDKGLVRSIGVSNCNL
jgi:diketogulonate reductase-like aldo/keto reductase